MPDLLDRLNHTLADRYTIEKELGTGGMATVYLAKDLKHHMDTGLSSMFEFVHHRTDHHHRLGKLVWQPHFGSYKYDPPPCS